MSLEQSIYPFQNRPKKYDKLDPELIEEMIEDYEQCFRHYSFKLGPSEQYWIILQYRKAGLCPIKHPKKPICSSYRPFTRTIRGLSILNVTQFQAIPLIQNICLCFQSMKLPIYVLLWIIDWLPNMDKVDKQEKLRLIKNMHQSCENIYTRRLSLKSSQSKSIYPKSDPD